MRDYHVHTTFSDGENTPEEMVQAALALGMTEIGFSDHSYVACDPTCGLPKDGLDAYIREINRLKAAYAGKIRILCGIEQDLLSGYRPDGVDYAIGSSHYLRGYGVDIDPETLRACAEKCFGGDFYALAEAYFAQVGQVAAVTGAQIVGHFDLVCKFNEKSPMFDETHPRYVNAWKRAVDQLLPSGCVFEINTGAMSRGHKTVPYPAPPIANYILEKGGKLLWDSDSHRADTLCYGFREIYP